MSPSEIKHTLYVYKAYVNDVYDGDTITVSIDLGMNVILSNVKIRMFGYDAPEMKNDFDGKGERARDFLRTLILNEWITIITIKDTKEKYGRYLGTVLFEDKNINELMIKHCQGEEWEG